MKRVMMTLFFVGMTLPILMLFPTKAISGVNINIGINVPPAVVIPSSPALVLIPGTYVYFVPDIEADILFYHGYWYRPYEGHWYRATSYNGKWEYIAPSKVPHVLIQIPPNFHHVPPGHERIPYGQLKKNWRKWERERYWDNHSEKEWHKEAKRGEQRQSKGGKKHRDD